MGGNSIQPPTHCGRVEAIHANGSVTVKWDGNGWKEIIDYSDLEKIGGQNYRMLARPARG